MELKKKLGCLHAHYSNIEYIENALSSFDIELIHFVDPGLMYRVTSDQNYQEADAQNKVLEQINWIAQCRVDAILITCTNYIAMLQEEKLSLSVPIISIDEPYFELICKIKEPQIILFTNPATVKGTMDRLNQYAKNHHESLDFEIMIIENTFDLLMQGRKQEYNQELTTFLNQLNNNDKVISVAQLSMVDAAQQVEKETSKTIMNPLNPLISYIVNQLKIS